VRELGSGKRSCKRLQVGEDAGAFDSSTQSAAKWTFFTVELGVVLAIMYAVSMTRHQIGAQRDNNMGWWVGDMWVSKQHGDGCPPIFKTTKL